MTTLREAAQQALGFTLRDFKSLRDFEAARAVLHDALRDALAQQPQTPCDIAEDGVCEVIDCCRNPAQQEQEPVAWQWLNTACFRKKLPANAEPGAWNPLYAHPPRREWHSLTDKEMEELLPLYSDPGADAEMLEFARAIEAKLKEKNHG